MADLINNLPISKSIPNIQRIRDIILNFFKGNSSSCGQGNQRQYQIFVPYSKEISCIQSLWILKFDKQEGLYIEIGLTYNRSIKGFLFNLTDQRLHVEIIYLLKTINQRCPYNMIFKMDINGLITTKVIIRWNIIPIQQPLYLQNYLKNIKNATQMAIFILAPYLALSPLRSNKMKQKSQQIKDLKLKYQTFRNTRNSHRRNIFSLFQLRSDIHLFNQLTFINTSQLRSTDNLFLYQSKYNKEYIEQQIGSKYNLQKKKEISDQCRMPLLQGVKIQKVIKQSIAKFEGGHSIVQIKQCCYAVSNTVYNLNCSNQQQSWKKQIGLLAIKTSKNELLSENSFKNELQFLMYIRNNKCSFIGNYFKGLNEKKSIYMKVYPTDLHRYLSSMRKKSIFISFQKKIKLLHQIVQGVRFLSVRHVSHRDIKQTNIMMSKSGFPKIIDFGSSCPIYGQNNFKIYDRQLKTTRGYHYPYHQCSSQIKQRYSEGQYQQHLFFDSYSIGKIAENIFKEYQISTDYIGSMLSENIQYITNRCMEEDPIDRLSYQEIQVFLELFYKNLHSSEE